MSESMVSADTSQAVASAASQKTKPEDKPLWVTPRLEDVSEQVMAQPYIRFT